MTTVSESEVKFINDPHNPETHEYAVQYIDGALFIVGERWHGYTGATGLRWYKENEHIHIDKVLSYFDYANQL